MCVCVRERERERAHRDGEHGEAAVADLRELHARELGALALHERVCESVCVCVNPYPAREGE